MGNKTSTRTECKRSTPSTFGTNATTTACCSGGNGSRCGSFGSGGGDGWQHGGSFGDGGGDSCSCGNGGGDGRHGGSFGNGGGDGMRCGSSGTTSTRRGSSTSATAESSFSSSPSLSLSLSTFSSASKSATFSSASKSGGRGDGGAGGASTLPVSSPRAPQKARCVTKLSRLNQASAAPDESNNEKTQSLVSPARIGRWGGRREEKKREAGSGGKKKTMTHLVKSVPQSQRYSRVPQVLACALRSAWTAYRLAQRGHAQRFSPCLRQKCFLIPVRSPSARAGEWCTQAGSGHTYTRRRGGGAPGPRCRRRQGRLWPRRCSCRFWSRWKPLPHTSHTKRFVASSVPGESAITSASGSAAAKAKRAKPSGHARGRGGSSGPAAAVARMPTPEQPRGTDTHTETWRPGEVPLLLDRSRRRSRQRHRRRLRLLLGPRLRVRRVRHR
uniref:Uncharacterized protein n=1 Tax=Zea mays TaxID=4577 RepID=A0A804MS96_MAIZE